MEYGPSVFLWCMSETLTICSREAVPEVEKIREQAQKFFSGGFETAMTVDEASMILGIALECLVFRLFIFSFRMRSA